MKRYGARIAVVLALCAACAGEKVKSAAQASAEAKGQPGAQPGGPATAAAGAGAAGDASAKAKETAQAAGDKAKETAQAAGTQAQAAGQAAGDKAKEVVTQMAPAKGPVVLALPPTAKPVVNLALRFRSGSVDDPPGKAGLTSLAARVMVEGGTQALDSKELLNALFPLAADLEVRVDREETTFYARVHKDVLDKLLPIFTDVLLRPRWDEKEFARLREAVVNDVEKRLRQGDDENLGKESLAELMYRGHPYGRLRLGHAADLKSMTLAEAKAQAARVFTADRLTIGLSGGYPAALPEQLTKALSPLPPGGPPLVQVQQQKVSPHPRILLVEKVTASTAISLGYPWALGRADADWPALSVARSAIGEHRQFNGRLMNRLREARGLNYGDYAYIEHFTQDGGDAATAQTGRARHQQDFTVWLRPVQNENRLFALRAALYELQRSLKDEPFTQAEVAQTKGFLDGYILLFDQTDGRKLGYALDDDFYGIKGFLPGWRKSLDRVTADQVNAAWRKWLDPMKLQIVLVGPDMAALKKQILAGEPSPMHYQKDAQGNVPEKPKELLAVDAVVEKFPLGATSDADVEVIPVDKMFE